MPNVEVTIVWSQLTMNKMYLVIWNCVFYLIILCVLFYCSYHCWICLSIVSSHFDLWLDRYKIFFAIGEWVTTTVVKQYFIWVWTSSLLNHWLGFNYLPSLQVIHLLHMGLILILLWYPQGLHVKFFSLCDGCLTSLSTTL